MKESRKRLPKQRFLRLQNFVRKGGRDWGEKSVVTADIPESRNSMYKNTEAQERCDMLREQQRVAVAV